MATIQDIVLKDVQKRRLPSKHYAYLIDVHWSDGKTITIGRRYSEFFDFQMSLLEAFPAEAGQQNPNDRSIPFLPGKTLFRRTNTKDFAMKRMGQIAEYCTGIAKMPAHISGSKYVMDFFRPNSDDKDILRKDRTLSASPEKDNRKSTANEITGPLVLDKFVAIADYKKDNKKELNLKAGEVVEVVEKSENGWWLAANEEGMNGWVPAVFLESLYGEQAGSPTEKRFKPGEGEMFKAITDYKANSDDEMSFYEGDLLEVLEKNLEGWWFANKDGAGGWVPATFLEKSSSSPAKSPTRNGNAGFRKSSAEQAKRPPPKRATVRRTLTKAAVKKVQTDFAAKMLKQESIEEDDEEFAGEYTTVGAFNATIDDGISFRMNETVHVIQKSSAGWWYGRIGEKRGWVPESYLREKKAEPVAPTPPLQRSQGIPLPKPLGMVTRTLESPKNTLGLNGNSTQNQISKSPKPKRPPAPAPKTFGVSKTLPLNTSAPPPKNETRSPLSPLPALPHNRGFIIPSHPTAPLGNKKDLSEYLWYRDVTRQEAEDALLCEGQEGYFIVRPSQRGGKQDKPYSLTLYHQNQNWNFHIRLRSDKKYAVGLFKESEAAFVTLPELVQYYKEFPLVIGEEERKVKLLGSPSELYDAC